MRSQMFLPGAYRLASALILVDSNQGIRIADFQKPRNLQRRTCIFLQVRNYGEKWLGFGKDTGMRFILYRETRK
jgi:hypothetical protein